MKSIPVFEVRQNADMTEGRGPMIHYAFFTNEDDAKQVVGPNNSWYDYRPNTLIVFDNIAEYNEKNRKDIIRRALKKLSEDERVALGLSGKDL